MRLNYLYNYYAFSFKFKQSKVWFTYLVYDYFKIISKTLIKNSNR